MTGPHTTCHSLDKIGTNFGTGKQLRTLNHFTVREDKKAKQAIIMLITGGRAFYQSWCSLHNKHVIHTITSHATMIKGGCRKNAN